MLPKDFEGGRNINLRQLRPFAAVSHLHHAQGLGHKHLKVWTSDKYQKRPVFDRSVTDIS